MEQGVTINSFNININNSKQKPQFNKAKYFERNYHKYNFSKSSFNRTFVGNQGLIDDNYLKGRQNNLFENNLTHGKQKLFENSMGNFKKRKWRKKKKQNHNIDNNSVQNKVFETSIVNSQGYKSYKKNINNYVRSPEYHNSTHNNNIPIETIIIPKNLYFGNDSSRISNASTNTKALNNSNKANYRKKKRKKQKDNKCKAGNNFTLDDKNSLTNNQIALNGSELNINKKQDSDLFYFDICGDKTHKSTPILVNKEVENKLGFLTKSFNTKSERKSSDQEIKNANTVEHKQILITNKTNVSHIVDANRDLKKQNRANESVTDNSNGGSGLSSVCDSTLCKKIKKKHRITKKQTEFNKSLRKDSSEVDILDCDTTNSLIYNKPTLEPAEMCTELGKNKKKNKNNVKKFNKVNNELEKIYDKNEITLEIDLGSSNTQQKYTVNEKDVNEEENIFHKKTKKRKRGHENSINLEGDCDISKHSFRKNYVKDRRDSVNLLENSGISKNTENMQQVFKIPNKLKKKNEIKSCDMVNISESECEIIDFSSSKGKKKRKIKTLKSNLKICDLEGSSNNTEDIFHSNEFDRMIAKSFKVKKKKSKHLQMEDNISHQLEQQNNCEEDIIDKHKNDRCLDSAIISEKYQCLDKESRYSKNLQHDEDTLGNERESVTTLGLKNYEVLQDKKEKINEINKKNRKRDVDFENECDINLISSNKKRKFSANNESNTNNQPKKKRRKEAIKSNIENPLDNSQIILNETEEVPLIVQLPKIKKKKHRTHQTESTVLDYLEGREPPKEEQKIENEMDCVELNLAKLFEDNHFGNEVLEEHNSILLERNTSTNDQSSDDSEIISSKWKSVKNKNYFTEIHENSINNLSIGNDALTLSKSPNKCQIDNLNPKIEVTSDNVQEDNQEYWSKSGHESTNGDKFLHQETEEEDFELSQDKDASDDETKGEDSSDTELSTIIKSEDTKSEEKWVRLDEIEKLQNLSITLNFAVPPLHALATRTTTPTKQQIKEIQKKNIPVKSGAFSKEEDKKMIENWKQLCNEYNVRMIPSLFIKFPSKMKMETKVNILCYIAHGLDDRPLHRVYIRFKHLLQKDHIKTGRFTSEEDEKILEFMVKTNSAHPFKDLAELLDRTSISVEKRYELLTTSDRKISCWTPQMVDKFIKALMKIAKCEKLSKLKHREFTSREWKKLSKKFDNIPVRKLQRAWKITIYPRLFSKNVNLRDMKKKIIQILRDRNEEDWRTIDWKDIAKQFKGFTADKIYMMFKHLIHFHVPRELRSELKECLDFLQDKLLKYDLIPATHKFKKFVIKEGCITYDDEDSN